MYDISAELKYEGEWRVFYVKLGESLTSRPQCLYVNPRHYLEGFSAMLPVDRSDMLAQQLRRIPGVWMVVISGDQFRVNFSENGFNANKAREAIKKTVQRVMESWVPWIYSRGEEGYSWRFHFGGVLLKARDTSSSYPREFDSIYYFPIDKFNPMTELGTEACIKLHTDTAKPHLIFPYAIEMKLRSNSMPAWPAVDEMYSNLVSTAVGVRSVSVNWNS